MKRPLERNAQNLLEQLPDPVYVRDAAGTFIYCNRAYARFIGRPIDSIVGSNFEDIFPPTTANRIRKLETAVLELGQPARYPISGVYESGQQRWMDVNAGPFHLKNGTRGVVGVLRDITEIKQAQSELEFRESFESTVLALATNFVNKTAREMEMGFDEVLTVASVLVEAERGFLLLYDRNKRCLRCQNEWKIGTLNNMADRFDVPPEEIGTAWWEAMTSFEPVEISDTEAVEEEETRSFFRLIDARAALTFPIHTQFETLGVLLFTQRVPSSGRAIEKYQLVSVVALLIANALVRSEIERLLNEYSKNLEKRVQDRTRDLDLAYETLKQTQSQLLQAGKMASIGQLAAGIAHEINNPIGFVKSNLSTLQRKASVMTATFREISELEPTAEVVASYDCQDMIEDLNATIEESLDGVRRVEKIVNNLRSFSRMDGEDRTLANVNDLLKTTLKVIWNEVKYKAEVIEEYGDIPDIYCHADRLNQVFLNILVNAVQSIPERGTITIFTGVDENRIMIQISDTGTGMDEETRERVFEPFFTTKDVGAGTGLGLSIVYDIVTAHKGTITVESGVGEGTTFLIGLPFDSADQAP